MDCLFRLLSATSGVVTSLELSDELRECVGIFSAGGEFFFLSSSSIECSGDPLMLVMLPSRER